MVRLSGFLFGLVFVFLVADIGMASKKSPKTASPEGSSPRHKGNSKSKLNNDGEKSSESPATIGSLKDTKTT